MTRLRFRLPLSAIIAFSATPELAHAATAAYFVGPQYEYISAGQEWSYISPQTPFEASHPSPSRVEITFGGWRAEFQSAPNGTLGPGNYERARRYPFNRGLTPGLTLSGQGRGCNKINGWFRVYEAEYAGTSVTRFAADFLQSCDGYPPVFGAIRINSDVPLHRAGPYARAVSSLVATEGDAVTLDGSSSFHRASSVTHSWTQTGGTPVLGTTSAPELTFTAPPVGPGGTDLQFALTVTDGNGNSDVVPVAVHVFDESDLRMRFQMDSERYDYIGQGRLNTYDEGNSVMAASIYYGLIHFPDEAALQIKVEGFEQWTLVLAMPKGHAPAPGVQGIVQRYPFRSPDRPALDFSGEGRGCGRISGWFEIVEVEIVGNTVNKLAADFHHRCGETGTELFGAIRFNSNVPFDRDVVYAVADRDVTLQEGQPLVLDGSASYSHDAPISSYSWSQVTGSTAVIAAPDAPSTPVTLPAVPPEGLELEFALRIADTRGSERSDTVTIRVRSKTEPQDYLLVDSDPRDWVGRGQSWLFTSDRSVFTFASNAQNGLHFDLRDDWHAQLELAAPGSAPLIPGYYADATRWPFGDGTDPQMSYSQHSHGCNQLSGWFNVLSLVEAGDGSIDTAAIDLQQHCEHNPWAVFARLRVNVAPDNEARSNAGADRYVAELAEVVLDGSGSTGGKAPVVTYAWSQVGGRTLALAGHATANPTFIAPELESGTREEYVFALNVTDAAGFMDRDTVAITVMHDVTDTDGDGVFDFEDAYPANPNESADSDGDMLGDNADDDDDNDGVPDAFDAFKNDPAEHADLDGDGFGDKLDADDDGDGSWDTTERLAPNGDGNKDTVPDDRQNEVVSGYAPNGDFVTVEAIPPTRLIQSASERMYAPQPAGYEHIPRVNYHQAEVVRGQTAQIRVWHPAGATHDRYFIQVLGAHIFLLSVVAEFDFDGTCGAEPFEDHILVHIIDGGCGDADGIVDGVIKHYGIPARLIGDDPPGDDPPSEDPPGDDPPGDEPPDDNPPGGIPPYPVRPNGGGGGSPGALLLVGLALLGCCRRRRVGRLFES